MTLEATEALPRHCPACDYDLAGLPAGHACPECGIVPDDRLIFIRGREIGPNSSVATSGPARAVWLAIWGTSFFWINALSNRLTGSGRAGWDTSDFIGVAIVVVILVAWPLHRRFSVDGPPAQLWMTARGYRVRGRSERHLGESPRVRRLWAFITWIFASLAIVAAMALFERDLAPWGVLLLIVAIVVATAAAASAVSASRQRPYLTRIPPVGWPIAFEPWHDVLVARVIRAADHLGEVEIRIQPPAAKFASLTRRSTVRLLVALTDRQAATLERLIDSYRTSGPAVAKTRL